MPMNLSDFIADDLTAHTLDLTRMSAGTAKKVRGMLKSLEQDLVSEISSLGIDSDSSDALKLRKLETLRKQTEKSIRKSYRSAKGILDDDLAELAVLETKVALNSVNNFLGVELMSTALPPTQVKKLVDGTLIQGAPSSEWWSRQAGTLQQSFQDEMRMGVLRGEGTAALTRRVRGRATGNFVTYELGGKTRRYREFAGGIMDTSTRQAEALVRTSVQNVANAARMETYRENADVIKQVQALAVLDGNTSATCQARSGMIWTLEGDPVDGNSEPFPGPPPWHFNCRSTLVPITKSWDELQKEATGKVKKRVEEMPPGKQATMDGQRAAGLNYQQWLQKKPRTFQREVLGPTKYEMFRKGDLQLRDLLDEQTGKPLTVKQLRLKMEPGSTQTIPSGPPKLKPLNTLTADKTLAQRVDEMLTHEGNQGLEETFEQLAQHDDFQNSEVTDSIVNRLMDGDDELEAFFMELTDDADLLREALDAADPEYLYDAIDPTVKDFLWQWVEDSAVYKPSILQIAAMQELGLATSTVKHLEMFIEYKNAIAFMKTPKLAAGARKFARILYDDTQEFLKQKGITEVFAYRGSRYQRTPTALMDEAQARGGLERIPSFKTSITSQPLNSWSLDPDTAMDFAMGPNLTGKESGAMFATRIPIKRIFSIGGRGLGAPDIFELVVLGGEDTVAVVMKASEVPFNLQEALFRLAEAQ